LSKARNLPFHFCRANQIAAVAHYIFLYPISSASYKKVVLLSKTAHHLLFKKQKTR
jgi:hypothetical protein